MKLPARVTDPDGLPGVAVRVVPLPQHEGRTAYEVIGPDKIIRTFRRENVRPGWPESGENLYESFLNGFR